MVTWHRDDSNDAVAIMCCTATVCRYHQAPTVILLRLLGSHIIHFVDGFSIFASILDHLSS